MGLLPPGAEPSDRWQLVGIDDAATPPFISGLLHTARTRAEWRRAGLPVLFDARGRVQHVTRGGRVYEFVYVREAPETREASLG
jgi:hypothetical protein